MRREPTWASPNRVVMASDLARLRDFDPECTDPVVPTLLFPPQAGHSSCIVDYSGEQSQVKTARAAGLTRLYSLDWVGATEHTKHASITDYLRFAEAAIEHIGGPVNLVGDCQGGWLATIYAALHPEHVHTLTIAGAPIDFHAGAGAINDYVRLLSPADMRFYEEVIRLGDGVLPRASSCSTASSRSSPRTRSPSTCSCSNHIRDEEHVARHRAFEDWFKHTQDIPGDFYLWIVERLFRDNALVRGELEIDGLRVDLAAIRCPSTCSPARRTTSRRPRRCSRSPTPSPRRREDIVQRVTGGGHLGLFMGREALRDHWPPIFAAVQARSRRAPAARAARRRARAVTPADRDAIPAP